MQDSIIRRPEVRNRTGLGDTTIDRLEAQGKFPKRVKITERSVGWNGREIQEWVAARLGGHAA